MGDIMKKALLLVSILFVSIVTTACINNLAVQELNTKAKAYLDDLLSYKVANPFDYVQFEFYFIVLFCICLLKHTQTISHT